MTVPLESWLEYEEEFRTFDERIRAARATRNEHRVAELNRLNAAQQKLVARASTDLPTRGPVADWMIAAVNEHSQEPTSRSGFALAVLSHRKQFPKIYLQAVVRAGAHGGYQGSRFIEFASLAHGQEDVLRTMVEVAHEGLFGPEEARFLLYYVRPRRWGGDDKSSPETCRRLVDELRRLLPQV